MMEPASRLGRAAILASAARAEAMLRAERWDAAAAAERSLELYDRTERLLDRARALLSKGQDTDTSSRSPSPRREPTAALAAFEALGAAGFAGKARAELDRVGLRPPAVLDLIEAERQMAGLTRRGMTGKTLFLSTDKGDLDEGVEEPMT